MKKEISKKRVFAGAAVLNRVQMSAIRGGESADAPVTTRCANTGAVCWFDGASGDSVVGKCEEMSSGQCRCVVRDKGGAATESVPFQECLG
ncbi:hypothetical protein VRU48_12835 [Pedobacter sp. KR3-3]|uniref:Uncharacterized protein n=1 Tax=Pedobacter albus TaxID=3113905 RepID=A0ABU7I9Z2_9SPHI|nr:hypothetical protein [Pedobacter sp. KR3-3]MEE1945999.1 hypothetical protein [Pedobacter sp. KR3-3]